MKPRYAHNKVTVINEPKYTINNETWMQLDTIQKSGFPIYFNLSSNEFTSDYGKTWFKSYSEAFQHQDW